MTSGDLLLKCYASAPSVGELSEYASECGLSLDEALERLSREVAQGFLSGVYTWHFGDRVMNNVYTASYVLSDICMPSGAFDIFCAFDAGEYSNDRADGQAEGEERTRALLFNLFSSRAA